MSTRLTVDQVPLGDLRPYPGNARRGDVAAIAESLQANGQFRPLVVQRSTGYVLSGNHTLQAAQRLTWPSIQVTYVDVDDDAARRIVLADNRTADLGGYDERALLALLQEVGEDLEGTGYREDDLDSLLASLEAPDVPEPTTPAAPAPTLADRFVVPPFTVLDARSGLWAERKRRWLGLGIQSELGRGEGLAHSNQAGIADIQSGWGVTATRDPAKKAGGPHPGGGGGGAWIGRSTDGTTAPADPAYAKGGRALTLAAASGRVPTYYAQKEAAEARLGRDLSHEEFTSDHLDATGASENLSTSGTSVFDPVLTELAVRWWSPPGGHVLDPFAGGSVRGVVTTHLGRSYEGVELRAEQVEANEEQRGLAPDGADLVWHQGDSRELPDGRPADLLLTCPPYAYLERYSDDPADLSTLDWDGFRAAHRQVISRAVARLAEDRFIVWVVGEVRSRGGDGHSVGLIADTIDAFQQVGCDLYNELIYVTPVGSLAVRIGRQFTAGRKAGRTHQHVLVFVKGDGMRAAQACGPVEVEVPDTETAEPDGLEDLAVPPLPEELEVPRAAFSG